VRQWCGQLACARVRCLSVSDWATLLSMTGDPNLLRHRTHKPSSSLPPVLDPFGICLSFPLHIPRACRKEDLRKSSLGCGRFLGKLDPTCSCLPSPHPSPRTESEPFCVQSAQGEHVVSKAFLKGHAPSCRAWLHSPSLWQCSVTASVLQPGDWR
jgi:hypothetical protein